MGRNDTIRAQIDQRNIPFLVHFTQIENLPGIMDHGLLSQRAIVARGLPALASHPGRLDGNDDAVSVSIASSDFGMFGAKRHGLPGSRWVLLLLHLDILWKLECRFHACNMATNAA
ncbi:DarT ssDNA thymidine ADP-ribosyltransferase family protein [Cereibacter johrii]|uniref:DarT ssDNA thymidine ADP-ribosyltransferase family protein n=1 Tax=Cereibacter johrii TaxID=445629 RepID=UPI002B259FB4|nr:DarT ssDNA thymidine ADP-ribosyltransferase family protein [Cereibacter johrii]MEA5160996.1 DarT ssDNA thymidine ADP-ribosyltransferase family protein [Cereibacter johrii]